MSATVPQNRRAVIATATGAVSVQSVSVPTPGSKELIVRTIAVGLNPTDWKSLDRVPAVGAIIGIDFSGIVEIVGKEVNRFKPGDHVAGFVHGSVSSDHDYGAFTTYVLAFEFLTTKLPPTMTHVEGAIIGVGITTVGQALCQTLRIPLPRVPSAASSQRPGLAKTILIYGGSSATGSLAIQFAVMSGIKVITTCSASAFDRMLALGADKAFDYRNEDCARDIKAYTLDNLDMVFDCISQKSTLDLCVQSMGYNGGTIVTVLRPDPAIEHPHNVTMVHVLSYTAVGKAFVKGDGGPVTPAQPEDAVFAALWWERVERILSGHSLHLGKVEIHEGGLEGIAKGLKIGATGLDGTGPGGKMVYPIVPVQAMRYEGGT